MDGSTKKIKVPQLAWWGDVETELNFPRNFDITFCKMNGHNAPKINEEDFQNAFNNPIGCKPIRELAKGKKNVVILFDDMSRPTKASEIAPFVIKELLIGGVKDDNIQFICALGSHGPLTAYDFAKKLGEDIIARFNVYNHNVYENCTYIGRTTFATPVSLNNEFVNADLKIGIGSILPHIDVGFGGGGKIVLPGISSIETITHNHRFAWGKDENNDINTDKNPGADQVNIQLKDIEEACKISGMDVKIDAILNIKRDITALFVGDPIAQYYEGVKLAKRHYLTPKPERAEIVVANCNAKINEAVIGMAVAESLLPDSGGTIVMINNNPSGEVCHYLRRSFGNHMGGRFWRPPTISKKIKRLILLMPYKNKASTDWLAPSEAITWAKKWEDVLKILNSDYPDGGRVAVIPDATIQLFDRSKFL